MNIEFKNISKSFDKKLVIHNVSFAVPSGEIVCLLGPSGSGKTTIIRLLIGAIAADKGKITIDGTKVPNLKLLKKIGFMPQNDALYDDLSGENNLKFFADLYSIDKNSASKRIDELLTLMDLTNDRKKYVRHYSGGMKKRLSLAISLLHKPDILLLDEPTVGIDPVLRRSIWNELQRLASAGKTILVSTHVMDEVARCQKVALVYNGSLIEYDTVDNIFSKTDGNVEQLFFQAKQQQQGGANV